MKNIEELEEQELDSILSEIAPDGTLLTAAGHFESDSLHRVPSPYGAYAYIYKMIDMQRYYVGIAAARAIDTLPVGGTFLIDSNGFVSNMDEVIEAVELIGLSFKIVKDGIYIFEKKE